MTDVYGYDQTQDNRYGGQMQTGQQQTHVISMTTVEQPVKWSWCHVVTSVIGFFCCQPFGLISVVMSLLAYSDHKTKDFGRSRNKKNMALGFGITAIVLGVLGFIIMIIAIAVIGAAAKSAIEESQNLGSSYANDFNKNFNSNFN